MCTGCTLMGEFVGAGGRCRNRTVSIRGVPEHETHDADARSLGQYSSLGVPNLRESGPGANEASALRQCCSAKWGRTKSNFSSFVFLCFRPFLLWVLFSCFCGRGRHQMPQNESELLAQMEHKNLYYASIGGRVIGSPTAVSPCFCHFLLM